MSAPTDLPTESEPLLYVPTWECCCCLGVLGRTPDLVPCVNTNPLCLKHSVCYGCSTKLPREEGQAPLCPICRKPCGEFLPLRVLMNPNKNPANAENPKRARIAPPAESPMAPRPSAAAPNEPQRPPTQHPAVGLDLALRRVAVLTPLLDRALYAMSAERKRVLVFCSPAVPEFDAAIVRRDERGWVLDMSQQHALVDAVAEAASVMNRLHPTTHVEAVRNLDFGIYRREALYYMLVKVTRQPAAGEPPISDAENALALSVAPTPTRWRPEIVAWDSKQFVRLRESMLDQMIADLLRVAEPLQPGVPYYVFRYSTPEFEHSAARIVAGRAQDPIVLLSIAQRTAARVAPRYPALELCVGQQRVPGDENVAAYLCVTVVARGK